MMCLLRSLNYAVGDIRELKEKEVYEYIEKLCKQNCFTELDDNVRAIICVNNALVDVIFI